MGTIRYSTHPSKQKDNSISRQNYYYVRDLLRNNLNKRVSMDTSKKERQISWQCLIWADNKEPQLDLKTKETGPTGHIQDTHVPASDYTVKIRLIENNAKCRHLKKLTCKGPLRQVFYLSEVPSPPMTPNSPPPLTHCLPVYSTIYLFTQRRGGGGGLKRRGGKKW